MATVRAFVTEHPRVHEIAADVVLARLGAFAVQRGFQIAAGTAQVTRADLEYRRWLARGARAQGEADAEQDRKMSPVHARTDPQREESLGAAGRESKLDGSAIVAIGFDGARRLKLLACCCPVGGNRRGDA